jgi:hypothetical protein
MIERQPESGEVIHPDDHIAMAQFQNADHYVEHDGKPYPEWWEVTRKMPTTTKPNIQSNSLKDIAGV